MKYILAIVVILWQTSTSPEEVRKQINGSQRAARRQISEKGTRWKYVQTESHSKSISYYALQQFDSIYRSQGQEPFRDSLNFAVLYDIAGYYSGMIWRDTTSILTWEYINDFHFKMRSVSEISGSQLKIVRLVNVKTDSMYRQIAPEGIGGQEHGDYVSLTRWYAPAGKGKTETLLFFIPPRK